MWHFAFILAMLSNPAFTVSDGSDTTKGYAELCYQAVGIAPSQLEKIPNCDGTPEDGVVQLNSYSHEKRSIKKDCDLPTWAETDCYSGSFARYIPIGKSGVYALLLCRRGHGSEKTPFDRYSNVSIILYSRNNGKTCFFTANADSDWKSGRNIPALHSDAGKKYWYTPKQMVEGFRPCTECHDSGPIMTSPWFWDQMTGNEKLPQKLRDFHVKAISNKKGPYDPFVGEFLNEDPRWKDSKAKMKFITVGSAGLVKGSSTPSCTSCHKIGIQETCNRWIDAATGKPADGLGKLRSPWAKRFPQSHWMPLEHEEKDWEGTYGEHVSLLKKCCKAAQISEAEMKKVPGCRYMEPTVPIEESGPTDPKTHGSRRE